MMQKAVSQKGLEIAHSGWFVWAVVESVVKSVHHFVLLMKEAAAHERDRRQLARLGEHMLGDIGLEPFDVYYGWRGSSR